MSGCVKDYMNDIPSLPESDFRALFESSPSCYLVLRPDLSIVAVSDAYLTATKTRRAGILGRRLFDVFPDNPDDPHATGVNNLRASLQRVLKNKAPDTMAVQKYDIRLPPALGGGFEEHHWSPVNSPVLGPDGEVIYVIHRVEDVTEFVRLKQRDRQQLEANLELQTRAEQMEMEILVRAQELQAANKQLRDNQIFLDSILENLPSMVFVKGARDLRFAFFNKAGERLLGYTRAELLGRNDYDFFPQEQADFFVQNDRRVIQSGVLVEISEEPIQTRHQGMRYLRTRKIPIFDSDGCPQHLLGISEDITERKAAEEKIRELHACLERNVQDLEIANRELVSFAYSVSHDLRAPLRAVNGYARILREDCAELSDVQFHGYLEKIANAASRMSLLIDGLLDLSRLSRQELHCEAIDLSEMARAITKELVDGEPGRDASVVIEDDMRAMGDPTLLQAAMHNLLHNAWKFSARSPNTYIQVGRLDHAASQDKVTYFVRDNGAGFSMRYQEKLFGPFQRLHGDKEFEGTGIGLATVQRIVQRHGGRIWAEAEEGRGATFFFTLG